jgi:hypothetical protein
MATMKLIGPLEETIFLAELKFGEKAEIHTRNIPLNAIAVYQCNG